MISLIMIMVTMATASSPTMMGTKMADSGMVGTQPEQEVTERSKEIKDRSKESQKKIKGVTI